MTVQSEAGAGTNYQVPITVYENATPFSVPQWYSMSTASYPISGNLTDQHGFDVVHTTNIVQCNIAIDGSTWTYLAYDSDSEGNNIYLYYSDSPTGPWTSYSAGPILTSAGSFRTPSVVYVDGVFEMFLNNLNTKDVERWTSSDGINFTYQETVLTCPDDEWTNPFVWLNPNDNNWYLFWVDGNNAGETWTIYARNSSSITGLADANDTLVLSYPASSTLRHMACPTIMYRDGQYWLLCESEPVDDGPWQVCAFVSTSVTSGYAECPNSPILTGDEACPQVFIADDNVSCYLFTNQNSFSWYQEERTVNPLTPTVAVTTNGHCLDNFGDIRFTAGDGATSLNYWMQSVSVGNYATFLVQDPDDLGSSNSTIYIYYGNNDATTTSNATNTLLFFDNFSADSSIDWTNAWQSSADSLYSLSGGTLVCSQANSGSQLIQTQASFGGGFCAEALIEETSSIGQAYLDMESTALTYTGNDNEILDYSMGTYDVFLGGLSLKASSTGDTTDFFTVVYKCPSSGSATGQIWLGSTQEISFSNAPSYTTAHVGLLDYVAGTEVVQWVYVRKYVNPEPYVTAVGPEERQQYTLAITVSPVGSGSVNLNNTGPYYYGDVVQLAAVAAAGWSFHGWSGDLNSSANPADLTITSGMATIATFTQNEYTLGVTVVGNGSVSSSPSQAIYTWGMNVTLNANASIGWTFAGWSGDASGTINPITVSVTASMAVTATFTQLLEHDVATTNVTTSKTGSVPMMTVGENFTATVNVTVANTGDYDESAVNVTVYATQTTYYNTTTQSWTLISLILQTPIAIGSNLVNLEVGQNATVTFTWNTTGFAYGNFTISAYVSPVLNQTNTANNYLTGGAVYVGVPGDINGDGTVDVYDAMILAAAFGSGPNSPNWNPNADINGDGTVDIYDAIILAAYFGQSIP